MTRTSRFVAAGSLVLFLAATALLTCTTLVQGQGDEKPKTGVEQKKSELPKPVDGKPAAKPSDKRTSTEGETAELLRQIDALREELAKLKKKLAEQQADVDLLRKRSELLELAEKGVIQIHPMPPAKAGAPKKADDAPAKKSASEALEKERAAAEAANKK